MNIWFVDSTGVHRHPRSDLEALLARGDGFAWIDVPSSTPRRSRVLTDTLGAHELVVRACRERNFVPTLHSYQHHVFVIMHTPLPGEGGHVHLLELDQLVGERYLITVHGPRNPVVALSDATTETDQVRHRIETGRFHPTTPAELFYAIGSAVARRDGAVVRSVAQRLPAQSHRR